MGKLQFCDVAGLEFHNSGPQWGEESEQLDVTVLSWEEGRGLETQVNSELDVVFVVLQGEGVATVGGEEIALSPGVVLPIPRGVERAVRSTSERLTYASIHQRRRGLMPKF